MDKERHNFWRTPNSVPRISSVYTPEENMRVLRLGALIPGISDHITVGEVASKLSWKDFHVLSCVSRGWRHAIRSRLVYEARVRSQTRETFVLVVAYLERIVCEIALYSMQDGSFHLLPHFPSFCNGGSSEWDGCVSVDGKVYLLGAARDVHVLDLAGPMHWKQCASMRKQRGRFRHGVMNGNIYVFGGSTGDGEVYDPKKNTWSPIRPIMKEYRLAEVAALGEELVYFDVRICDGMADPLVYHPVRDEWREVKYDGLPQTVLIVAKGKVYLMSVLDIHGYDADKMSWSQMHTFSIPMGRIGGVESVNQVIIYVLAVEDELLACMSSSSSKHMCLVQSKGFGGNKKEILWEEVPINLCLPDCLVDPDFSISPIQL